MDLIQLQAMGAIATRSLIPKDIPIRRPKTIDRKLWQDPDVPEFVDPPELINETLSTHIRKRSSADFVELMQAEPRHRAFVMIMRCVCKPDGTQVFDTLDQAEMLEDWLWMPLAAAVREVNPELFPKNSQPRTSSGASSRSPSAAGRSRNGKRRSPKKSARSGSPTAPSAAP